MDEAASWARIATLPFLEWVALFPVSSAHDPDQGLAKGRCQDADCERLIGVNIYGSGARLVITVAL
jgi:hypothetical protein